MPRNYQLLHPSDEADENLVILCQPDTRIERLVAVLKVAALTEYRRLAFGFGKRTTVERPLMGTRPRCRWTAAKALLPGVDPDEPTPIVALTVRDHATCDALARTVAEIRRGGKIARLGF
jgi:hypothetical protein